MPNCYSPYGGLNRPGRWLKCNFHVHGAAPSGENPAPEILKEYKKTGHDVVADSKESDYPDITGLGRQAGLTAVNGQEYLERDGILLVGAGRFLSGLPQRVIDQCNELGGFCVACHPNLDQSQGEFGPRPLSPEEILILDGLAGLEIVNGCMLLAEKAGNSLGDPFAADVWDEALLRGKRVWGFGNDDSHKGDGINTAWTMVYAASGDFEDIRAAVGAGCLYVSTGLSLADFDFDGKTLTVRAEDPLCPEDEPEYRFVGGGGKLLSAQTGRRGRITIPEGEPYVRAEAKGSGGAGLWTQPVIFGTL